mmetsp:Transcript_24399/g.65203  ORF Transcript_24399/g.65203 Transcript_24399/m.65203 type:complete len:97 (+) Transcript_24399:64-354(+)|eukprot:CAMPEP_0113728242 /NCGR_PEP_ID=MMETSP0038_2-20120614/41756_1 /TAXON_ID=2898 /ORGANISM="Cryptomonas paramecium" /LENGTH=96 /DNA_ID=CAMNT_0000659693 /DNA_START=53 /DNA_END=343 /DNA_ORIENTATION=- /assembly_acc=CAM_ASM_000170
MYVRNVENQVDRLLFELMLPVHALYALQRLAPREAHTTRSRNPWPALLLPLRASAVGAARSILLWLSKQDGSTLSTQRSAAASKSSQVYYPPLGGP